MTRSFSFLTWFGLVILASLALYHVSDRTQKLDLELRQLNSAIMSEKQNLHVIKADYVYLTNPERLEKSAKRFLAIRPSVPQQVASLNDIEHRLPTRGEALASAAVIRLADSSRPTQPVPTSGSSKTAIKSKVKLASTQPPAAARSTQSAQIAKAEPLPRPTTMPAHTQRTASALPLPDSIGAFLNGLGSRP